MRDTKDPSTKSPPEAFAPDSRRGRGKAFLLRISILLFPLLLFLLPSQGLHTKYPSIDNNNYAGTGTKIHLLFPEGTH
jgi:hypothetical protein